MRIIGGRFKGRVLQSGEKVRGKRRIRPTTGLVRGAIFSILGKENVQGKRVLDLFAGTGALGLEALSRGAEGVTFVENDRRALQLLEENISILGMKGAAGILTSDVFRGLSVLETKGEKFNLIFADPPYASGLGEKLLEKLDKSALLADDGILVLECGAKERPFEPGGLEQIDARIYGDTQVLIYRKNPKRERNDSNLDLPWIV